MRLKTEALTIFTDEDRMTSNKKVQMTLGAATATGTGMVANNATRQIDLKGRGQLVLPPTAARQAPN
jgi:lipopolysaccharide export system protein LptC